MMFEFNFITMHEISLEIIGINSNKSNPIDSIPAKMIKENSSFFCSLLYNNFNNCISMCTFPSKLKLADVSPLHKKGVRMDKFIVQSAFFLRFPKFMKEYYVLR